MSDLIPCAACSRHVKSHECICPFCGAHRQCARALKGIAPSNRITRAAAVTAGVLSVGFAVANCSAKAIAMYGGPHIPDDAAVPDTGHSGDSGPYGDSGNEDVGAPSDAPSEVG